MCSSRRCKSAQPRKQVVDRSLTRGSRRIVVFNVTVSGDILQRKAVPVLSGLGQKNHQIHVTIRSLFSSVIRLLC
jgi:hypothetical protein